MTGAWCEAHGVYHEAPLCELCGEPKKLLGYDTGPHAWGHIWDCVCAELGVSPMVEGD